MLIRIIATFILRKTAKQDHSFACANFDDVAFIQFRIDAYEFGIMEALFVLLVLKQTSILEFSLTNCEYTFRNTQEKKGKNYSNMKIKDCNMLHIMYLFKIRNSAFV